MTREEKIKGLYSLKEYLVENPIELEGHKSLPITLIDYAIKALEQEPFINKPCVSSGVCEHDKQKVLDKIRAEIEQARYGLVNDGLDIALNILDKYKPECEVDNGNDEQRGNT